MSSYKTTPSIGRCEARHDGWRCNRRNGHDGRHMASNGMDLESGCIGELNVVAEWEDD